MKFKIEKARWAPNEPFGTRPLQRLGSTELRRLADFMTKAGLEIPRLVSIQLRDGEARVRPPNREKNEPLGAYRRRVRRWRKELFGSIRKMRRAKKEQRVKEQRWALLREQGFPLKDPEALVWFIKTNMWKGSSKLAQYGYLRHSVLMEVSGGALPTGIDFDEVYYDLSAGAKSRRADRDHRKKPETEPLALDVRFRNVAQVALSGAHRAAKFRVKNKSADVSIYINNLKRGEVGASMTITDGYNLRRGRKRHFSDTKVEVNLDWYRKVYKRGLANAAGKRSLVLDVIRLANGEERALVARQESAVRYALTVGYMKFGKNNDGTYWFREA